MQLAVGAALLIGCGVVSTTLWFYSRRYIGELSLIRRPMRPPAVCISVLDFWGNREVNSLTRHGQILNHGDDAFCIFSSLVQIICQFSAPVKHQTCNLAVL